MNHNETIEYAVRQAALMKENPHHGGVACLRDAAASARALGEPGCRPEF
jgi:hypothetical protein